MRLAVIGAHGQIAQSLKARAPLFGAQLICLARPDLDLAQEDTIFNAIAAAKADIIVNAGAFTEVDLAETEAQTASAINGDGAGFVAKACAALNIPIIYISTDYVFDGEASTPYEENTQTSPKSVYGKTKLLGEEKTIAATKNHVILRTSWLYSPFSKNFVKTMLALANSGKSELKIVKDQTGTPTSALEVADAIFEIAANLLSAPDNMELRGIFHLSGKGKTNWARFARYIFGYSKRLGGNGCKVISISAAEYGAKAPRPQYSVLDNSKVLLTHGIGTNKWQDSVKDVINQIKSETGNTQ